jgi:hypothetical protein
LREIDKIVSPAEKSAMPQVTVRDALADSCREIRTRIEHHEWLLEHLEDGAGLLVSDSTLMKCGHGGCFRKLLLETVEVLENSKKAFKSKELETLRKKLTRALADDA